MKTACFLLLIISFLPLHCRAQTFIQPLNPDAIDNLSGSPCTVTLSTGEELHGTVKGGGFMGRTITNITVVLDNGKKVKYKPEDMVSIKAKPPYRSLYDIVRESGYSMDEDLGEDIDRYIEREYITFASVPLDENGGRIRFMQLINPGFDSKMKVYAFVRKDLNLVRVTDGDASKKQRVSEDEDQTEEEEETPLPEPTYSTDLVFVKKGEKPVRIFDYTYLSEFPSLFFDCPQMKKMFSGHNLRLEDMAGHVWVYDRMCEGSL
ncbi:MAG TPA: hypothetical protein VK179_00990 [Bacteroidales bacterium]|nr:hypothetical protein [Bacteroidales bacterium]